MNLGAELPLAQAAAKGQTGVIQTLLAAGAKANMRDSDGHPALVHAAWMGRQELVKLLLQKGANPNKGNQYGNQQRSQKVIPASQQIEVPRATFSHNIMVRCHA